MLGYMVWSSAFAVPPLLALSLIIEGPAAIVQGIADADAAVWAAVLWQSVGNTLFGYAAWAWLLARHPAATVTPMALLVPVFGIGASAWWLGEPLPPWKLAAAALVVERAGAESVRPAAARCCRATLTQPSAHADGDAYGRCLTFMHRLGPMFSTRRMKELAYELGPYPRQLETDDRQGTPAMGKADR